jgi:hypothetical protein
VNAAAVAARTAKMASFIVLSKGNRCEIEAYVKASHENTVQTKDLTRELMTIHPKGNFVKT